MSAGRFLVIVGDAPAAQRYLAAHDLTVDGSLTRVATDREALEAALKLRWPPDVDLILARGVTAVRFKPRGLELIQRFREGGANVQTWRG